MFKTHFNIEETISIDASIDVVWENIVFFHKQAIWSPWLIVEPTCTRETTENDGEVWAIDSWEWEVIWSGERENLEIIPRKILRQEIRFQKPFTSVWEVYFQLSENNGKVDVLWWMNGNLPIFLFFLKNMTILFIQKDYSRGLNMLKVLCETWKLETTTTDSWTSDLAKMYYIGRRKTLHISEMWPGMKEDFWKVMQCISRNEIIPEKYISFYPEVDMKKGIFSYIAAVSVSQADYKKVSLDAWIVKGSYKPSKIYIATHAWSYSFLPNTWTAVHMYIRHYKYKINKRNAPFEEYHNNPSETPESDLITTVNVPIK